MRSVNFIRFIVIAVAKVTSSISLLGAAPLQQPPSELTNDSQQRSEPTQEFQIIEKIDDMAVRTETNFFMRDSMAASFSSSDETSMSLTRDNGLIGLALSPRVSFGERSQSIDVQIGNLGGPFIITAASSYQRNLFFGLPVTPESSNSNYTLTIDVQTKNLGAPLSRIAIDLAFSLAEIVGSEILYLQWEWL